MIRSAKSKTEIHFCSCFLSCGSAKYYSRNGFKNKFSSISVLAEDEAASSGCLVLSIMIEESGCRFGFLCRLVVDELLHALAAGVGVQQLGEAARFEFEGELSRKLEGGIHDLERLSKSRQLASRFHTHDGTHCRRSEDSAGLAVEDGTQAALLDSRLVAFCARTAGDLDRTCEESAGRHHF